MTGVSYSFDLDDLQVVSAIVQIAAADEDLHPLMDAIGRVLVNGAIERIADTNTSADGVAWPKSLRAELDGGKTLLHSGRLMRSITSEAGARQVVVGSNLIYAGVHQTGATIRAKTAEGLAFTLANGEQVVVGQVTIPARPYLGISRDEVEDVSDLTAAHFDALLAGGQ